MLISPGCGDKTAQTPVEAPSSGPQKAKTIPPSPQKAEETDTPKIYSYNPTGKPDPFKPFISASRSKGTLADTGTTPLQNLEVNQLTLIGVISDSPEPLAMVEDASGKGYVLRIGSRVGLHEGLVSKIFADRVVVTEKHRDFRGKVIQRSVTLRLSVADKGER